MMLFTFIATPVIATLFSDSTCFLYVMEGQASIQATFDVPQFVCLAFGEKSLCSFQFADIPVSTTVVPSWLYSYQCSSSLLINYIPVLLFSFLISGVLQPCLVMTYHQLSSEWIERVLPSNAISLFLHDTINMHKAQNESDESASRVSSNIDQGMTESVKVTGKRGSVDGNVPSSRRSLINKSKVMSKCMLNLAVALTFGLASPLLLVCVFVDSCSTVFVWSKTIERFIKLHEELCLISVTGADADIRVREELRVKIVKDAMERLELNCAGLTAGFVTCLYMVVSVAGLFWSYFVFDMIGDVYGSLAGGLTMLVPILGALISFEVTRRLKFSPTIITMFQTQREVESSIFNPFNPVVKPPRDNIQAPRESESNSYF
jgi:hypothetical protein